MPETISKARTEICIKLCFRNVYGKESKKFEGSNFFYFMTPLTVTFLNLAGIAAVIFSDMLFAV